VRLGFACLWDKFPEKTWSGTPWALRNALERQTEVVNLGVEYSASRTLLKYAYVRRRHGSWVTTYKRSGIHDWLTRKKLQAGLNREAVDAVIEVGDLAQLEAPYYVYQDLSYDVLEKYYNPNTGAFGFRGTLFRAIDLDTIRRRRERQHEIYESAAGIFAMSEWFADTLVKWSDIPRDKVTVVYAGLNSIAPSIEDSARLEEAGHREKAARLLFIGRDFFRKGGEIVVEALAHLRREYSPDIHLTVVGPEAWPLPGEIPEGVLFFGSRSTTEVARLYRSHDLLVMPSHFEAFGIVFIEALASGIPVIGRSAFAMPEIIEPGKNGALVKGDDPAELASAVVEVLENPGVHEFTARTARDIRERFSWDAVAGRMVAAMAHLT
jgi:glycosyltransferase involved in cell wall biosynthesis